MFEWIWGNRLLLNTSKTELVVFKSKEKIITKHLNFCISGQKIKPSSQVKPLGIILQDDLHWNSHLTKLRKKLSCSISLLSKVRYYLPNYLLRAIYHSIFNSHLIYACEIWGQNQKNYFKKLIHLQEKAIWFQPQKSPSNCTFKHNKILKISDFVNYKYLLFVGKSLRSKNLVIFNDVYPTKTKPQTTITLILLKTIFPIYLRSKHATIGLTPGIYSFKSMEWYLKEIK